MLVPSRDDPERSEHTFSSNMPEYMDHLFGNRPIRLSSICQKGIVSAKTSTRDPIDFARQVLLWGRKSGAILNDCRWVHMEHSLLSADS